MRGTACLGVDDYFKDIAAAAADTFVQTAHFFPGLFIILEFDLRAVITK